ncbi:MAG: O-antigen ligase family protein [Bacteroidales bacterium]|nr:O-antigen ligase family protein [Bacteroidales bacterium]
MIKKLDIFDFSIYVLIALLIPLYTRGVPVLMIVLIFTAFLRKSTYVNIPKIIVSKDFLILVLPFLLMLIGYFYSSNKSEAFHNIEKGLSLIIFPFIFYFFKNNTLSDRSHYVFKAFVIGILVSYVILWINVYPKYMETKSTSLLFYTSFSMFIKTPNHLSYNVLFAIIIVFLNLLGANQILFKNNSKATKVISFFLFLVLSLFLFQLVAKSTIIIYLFAIITIVVYAYLKKTIKASTLIVVLAILVGLTVFSLTIPNVKIRFTNMLDIFVHNREINYNEKESSTLRYSAIKSSCEIISENWVFGVGTGDVLDELDRNYSENNYWAAEYNHTNPHNQYLRSFLMSGIFGLISILLIFFLLAKKAFEKKSILAVFWTFIMILIFAIDDMFIFRDGVIYFAFFTSYFVFCHPSAKSFLCLESDDNP